MSESVLSGGWSDSSAGENRALSIDQIFRAHFDDVYRMAARLLGPGASAFDVEDVTQQVFIAAERALPKFRGECKVTTWLYSIASNIVLTQLRSWRRQRRLKRALAEAPLPKTDRITPEHAASDREQLHRVWRCLMGISPKKRIVYVLYEVEGMSGAEIAQIVRIPEATVWTRLHHARRDLLEALERLDQEGLK